MSENTITCSMSMPDHWNMETKKLNLYHSDWRDCPDPHCDIDGYPPDEQGVCVNVAKHGDYE